MQNSWDAGTGTVVNISHYEMGKKNNDHGRETFNRFARDVIFYRQGNIITRTMLNL